MPRNVAVVTARKKKPAEHGKEVKHKHPVREARIKPADNGGFNSEIEMHPEETGPSSGYQPGAVMSGAHPNLNAALKHVKASLTLKNDQQEQGSGELPGGNPGDNDDAE